MMRATNHRLFATLRIAVRPPNLLQCIDNVERKGAVVVTQSPSKEDLWQSGYLGDGHAFAERCAYYRDTNPFEQPALETIMIYLATELWDRGFSQSDIKTAFEAAVELLKPYAAGEERRGRA